MVFCLFSVMDTYFLPYCQFIIVLYSFTFFVRCSVLLIYSWQQFVFFFCLLATKTHFQNAIWALMFFYVVIRISRISFLRNINRRYVMKNLTFREPCTMIYSYNKSLQDALFLNFILVKNSTCFGQTYCPSSGVLILYSQQFVFVILVPSRRL